MARVYTRKAGKDYPDQGIKKGDTYYAWSFYRQAERKSLTYPSRSQLTQNSYYETIYGLFDDSDRIAAMDSPEDLEEFAEEVRAAGEGEQEKLDNMGDALAQGDTGQQIQEHIDNAESSASELEDLANEWRDAFDAWEEATKEHDEWQAAKDAYDTWVAGGKVGDEVDLPGDEPDEPDEEFDSSEYTGQVGDHEPE